MMYYITIFIIAMPIVTSILIKTDELLRSTYKLEMNQDCVSQKIELTAYNNISNCAVQYQGLNGDEILKIYCSDDYEHCPDIIKRELSPCLTANQKDYMQVRGTVEDAIRHIMCNRFSNIIKDSKNINYSTCSQPEFSNRGEDCFRLAMLINDINMEEDFKEEACWVRYNFSKCLKERFDLCQNKTMYNFHSQIMCINVNATPCKEFLKECPSQTIDNENEPESKSEKMVNFHIALSFNGSFPLSSLNTILNLT